MSAEGFEVRLAGRRWLLPPLPFRIVKTIQPALFQAYSEAAQAGSGGLKEGQIDALAGAVWRALAHVEAGLTWEEFVSWPFSVTDLLAALPAVAQAVGLSAQTATAEASPDAGKSISTP